MVLNDAQLQGQQESVVYLTKDSITWLYMGVKNVSNSLNEFTILIRPMNGEVQHLLNLSLKMQSNVNMKLSIDIVGGERIYYHFDSSLSLVNNTSGINKIEESVEGNINIDLKDIVIQWHKQEVRIPLRLWSNTTSTVLLLGKELDRIVLNMNYTYVKKLNGFHVAEQLRNGYRESFYFYDIYINKTQYIDSLFNADAESCKVINKLPMKTSIDLTVNASMQECTIRLNIQGINVDDPIKAYQAYLCVLPLILNIQEILKKIDVGNRFSIEFFGISTSFFTKINQNFIINLLKVYADITNIIAMDYADLMDSQIVFSYKNKDQQHILLTISNIDVYYYNSTQLKTLLKKIVGSVLENVGIIQYQYLSIIDQSSLLFQNEYTTPVSTFNKINVWSVLMFVIIAVSIQTGVLVYVMMKIIRSRYSN